MRLSRSSSIFAAIFLVAATVPGLAQSVNPAASSAAPIPDIVTLMHQVLENQNQVDKIRENYACRDARQVEKLDKGGRVKKTSTSVYQISFFGGHQIQRLIEEDGQPLSAKDQEKEDDRIRKQVEKYEKEQQSGKEAERREKDEVTIQNFLEADRFLNPRRERIEGHDVIAFDFEANPAFKPKSLTQKLAQALVGTIWIDAQAHEVVRLNARFAKNLKVGWGLMASVHRGTAVAFEQTLVHNEVWLPTYEEVHVSARALFFGVNQNETNRYSDYQRFRVQSSSKLFPPKSN
ncbi:MAG: hypothetical protein KGL59_11080 [Acidobacteriota bacterium]|nr:hypothetical protein [Acidobacteriota bacterium]